MLQTYKKRSTKFECIFFLDDEDSSLSMDYIQVKNWHTVLIDWVIHIGLLQPFEVVELKTLRHDCLQSPSHPLTEEADSSFCSCQLTVVLLPVRWRRPITSTCWWRRSIASPGMCVWPGSLVNSTRSSGRPPSLNWWVLSKNQWINRYLQEDTITTNNAWDVEEPKSEKSPV